MAAPPPTPHSNTALDISVNPVDVLAKKLRQQAAELTQVYEQMEKKDQDLDRLRGEVKQLNMQIDVQRTKQRKTLSSRSGAVTSTSTVSRSATSTGKKNLTTPARRTSGAASEAPRREARQPQDALILPHNQEDVEEMREAIRRIEETLSELRQHHHELMSQGVTVDVSDLQLEQRLYIRVLEEAVHLKASELCITGHEELLVVLAELRHTIYQQENEIGELQKSLAGMRSEHLECKTLKLEADDKLQRELSRWEQETTSQRLRETSLQRKLEEVQRLAHAEHMRFREERAAQEEQTQRISALEKELQLKTQDSRRWEAMQETWAKKEAALAKQLQELQQTVEQERAQHSSVREDLSKSQCLVEELKALQEGLLQSIDQFVTKEDAHERQIKALEAEVARTQQIRSENQVLRVEMEEFRRQVRVLEEESVEVKHLAKKWDAIEVTNSTVEHVMEEGSSLSGGEEKAGLDVVSRWLQALSTASECSKESLPWLQSFLDQATASLSTIRDHIIRVEADCSALRESKSAFEQSTTTITENVRCLQEALAETESKLAQAQTQVEEQCVQLSVMEEEVRDARAQEHLRDALATQIFEQENLLSTQQQRLQNVLLQNAELMALETQLATQLEEKDQRQSELQHRLRQYLEQEAVLHELEQELEDAVALTEQQNAWNQQLTEALERVEWEKAEQEQAREAVETREQVVVSRLTTIFTQYAQFVSANKQRLAHEFNTGREARVIRAAPKTIYDEARESGDVIQMLRVFPTLVEEYLASAVLGATSSAGSGRKLRSKANQRESPDILAVLGSRSSKVKSTLPNHPIDEADLSDPLDAQLREISKAFNKFKSV